MTFSLSFCAAALLWSAFLFFTLRRMPRYLHIFQQEEYDNRRFLRWLGATRAFDRKTTLGLGVLVVAQIVMSDLVPAWVFAAAAAALGGLLALFEPDPRQSAKKKLVLTARATRIFVLALILTATADAFLMRHGSLIGALVALHLIPFMLPLANLLLAPYEKAVQNKFRDEAIARLHEVRPPVIGITGSFGKTSVKHILGHVLEMNAPTLYTPGSINTIMGISRIIRERLTADCRFFLVEMGAYGIGSIARLCAFTPPDTGIITALGEAHYERFKSLDAVAHAKFELAEAVIAKGKGSIIIHESVLNQPYARAFVDAHANRFVVCGTSETCAYRILKASQDAQGLHVDVLTQKTGETTTLFAPLYGLHHASNVVLAYAAAVDQGLSPARIIAALRTVPQIAHRLEVKPQAGGGFAIDDAYNANQQGFTNAVELLSLLSKETGGRRILVTPGVAELGAHHDSVHAELGAVSAAHVDVALVIRPDRIPSFVEAFKKAGSPAQLHTFPSLAEAQDWLRANGQARDIVLIENDLPDLYEKTLKL